MYIYTFHLTMHILELLEYLMFNIAGFLLHSGKWFVSLHVQFMSFN